MEEEEDDDVEEEKQSQEHFVRACAIETHMDISHEPFCMEIYRKNAGRRSRGQHFVRACAVEKHMDMSQEPFCVKFTRKMPDPNPATHVFCASLRSRDAHGHVTRAILCGTLQEKCRTPIPRHTFCASLRSRNAHGWTFHKSHFVWKSSGKMPNAYENTSIKHRALTPTVRTPQCCHYSLVNFDVIRDDQIG